MFSKLLNKGILSINARNLNYISTCNSKEAMKLADDKLYTKEILGKAKVPTPKLYAVIRNRRDLNEFQWDLPDDFVLKPNAGFGGEGIMVIVEKKKEGWVTAGKSVLTKADITRHIIEILDGNFSISGVPDVAFFEHRLITHDAFKKVAYKGIPDIRVIVYRNIPVMAMIRLPTKTSEGKANLHLGAIGAGIDIATGITTNGVMKGKQVDVAPDTGHKIKGLKIPFWDKILEMSVKAQIASKLGYLGVDIVIDQDQGPLVLELNARPGLAIQIANLTPLKKRLDIAEKYNVKDPREGVKLAKELF